MTSKEFITAFWHAVSDAKRLELVEGLFKEGAEAQRKADQGWFDGLIGLASRNAEALRGQPLVEMPK